MFQEIILSIFRSTRLCVTACGTMHPRCCRPATSWVHYTTSCNTQSNAPEDGKNNCPKHVELTGIINKPLLLHQVGCLYYLYFIIFFWDLLNNLNLTLILKTCRIRWAPNTCKWQTGFNSACKGHCYHVVLWLSCIMLHDHQWAMRFFMLHTFLQFYLFPSHNGGPEFRFFWRGTAMNQSGAVSK